MLNYVEVKLKWHEMLPRRLYKYMTMHDLHMPVLKVAELDL